VTTARAPRVAIVGARRVRTGLGPFIAKHLVAHGAAVPAFIASRKETIEEGRAALRAVGVDAEGFVDLDELVAAHPVDALVVSTPHETHLGWLEAAMTRGLHVLCEKPLVWGDAETLRRGMKLLRLSKAAETDLVLFENCPWPYVLPAFDALHPGARREGVHSLEMEMSPTSEDPREMLVDALSHPISVLQECSPVVPRGRGTTAFTPLLDLRFDAAGRGRVDLSFTFQGSPRANRVAAAVRLRAVPRQPRPMAIVVNGFRAERRVRMEDYALFLTDGRREVRLADPMAALVGEFVGAIRDGEPARVRNWRTWKAATRLAVLDAIVGSFSGA
jgi:hypothetical protein